MAVTEEPLTETSCQRGYNALISATGGGGQRYSGKEDETYVPNDVHEVLRVGLWEATGGIHFMDKEGDVTRAEFLDKEMGKKIIISCKVVDFHDFGRAPFCPGGPLVSRRGVG